MAKAPRRVRSGPAIGRRRFLTGLGAGTAGAVALGPAQAVAGVVEGERAAAAVRADRFGRMFPDLPAFVAANAEPGRADRHGQAGGLMDAKDNLAAGPVLLDHRPALSVNNPDNPDPDRGHDVLRPVPRPRHDLRHHVAAGRADRAGAVAEHPDAGARPRPRLRRRPGRRPAAVRPGRPAQAADRGGRRASRTCRATPNGTAIIADPRNDENLMIAGLQAAFMLFHNRVVDRLRAAGRAAGPAVRPGPATGHLALPVDHPQRVPAADHRRRRRPGHPAPTAGASTGPSRGRRSSRWSSRVRRTGSGTAMVRPSYRANLRRRPRRQRRSSAFIFDPAGEGQADPVDLRGGARARAGSSAGRRSSTSATARCGANKRIDTRISTPLFNLPLRRDRRAATARPRCRSATCCATSPGASRPGSGSRRPSARRCCTCRSSPATASAWRTRPRSGTTCCAEAEMLADGLHLGPVGGRIVGEVFIGLLQLDPRVVPEGPARLAAHAAQPRRRARSAWSTC